MKLFEEVKNKLRNWLLEDLDPYRSWRVNWQTVTKSKDDASSIRVQKTQKAFQAWENNPLANSGLEYKIAYILGKGFEFTSPVPEIEEKLKAFWTENSLEISHIELTRSLFLDGEIFLQFMPIQFGQTPLMIPIDSSEIKYIARNPENFREITYYHRQYKIQKYPSIESNSPIMISGEELKDENIPADQMIHFKIYSLPNLSRGRGLLYQIFEYLDDYVNWLKTRTKLNKARGAFSWVFRLATDNEKDVENWQKKLNNFAQYDKDGNLIDTIPTGQPIVIGKSMDMKAENPSIGASEASEDGRQIKLMSAVGMRLPEFVLSDGQNANLATTQSQQSPLIKAMEMDQEMMRLLFRKVFDKVLEMLVDVGELSETYSIDITKPDGTMETVEKDILSSYELLFPEIAVSSIASLSTPLNNLVVSKILSREDACTLLGYEWEKVKEKIKQEESEGFVSPTPTTFGTPQINLTGELREAMAKDDLKRITILTGQCRAELKENYEEYKKNLLDGDPKAKDNFIRKHQDIVEKYLNQTSTEAYANKILETVK